MSSHLNVGSVSKISKLNLHPNKYIYKQKKHFISRNRNKSKNKKRKKPNFNVTTTCKRVGKR